MKDNFFKALGTALFLMLITLIFILSIILTLVLIYI